MLQQPLCGERRFAYCYVRPGIRHDFEGYIAERFGDALEAWLRDRLLDERWFGDGQVNARLAGRVGDYVLAMKHDWSICDRVPGERVVEMVGLHGGLTSSEMHIPLCSLTV